MEHGAHFERLPNQTHPIQVKSSLVETPWPKTSVSEKEHVQNVQCHWTGTGLFQRLLTMFHFSSRVEGVVFRPMGLWVRLQGSVQLGIVGFRKGMCCLDCGSDELRWRNDGTHTVKDSASAGHSLSATAATVAGGYWWTLINHSISCPHLRAALITSHAPAQTHTLL